MFSSTSALMVFDTTISLEKPALNKRQSGATIGGAASISKPIFPIYNLVYTPLMTKL